MRGAIRADGTQVHLPAAMNGTGLVLARREVDAKTDEIAVFRPLLAPLDLAGTVVTFDVLHSRTAHARFLVEDKNAHYIALIKGNHLTLHKLLKALPRRDVPLLGKTRATAHGRDEIRRVKTATVAQLPFPHASQALQIVRRRRNVTTGKVSLDGRAGGLSARVARGDVRAERGRQRHQQNLALLADRLVGDRLHEDLSAVWSKHSRFTPSPVFNAPALRAVWVVDRLSDPHNTK